MQRGIIAVRAHVAHQHPLAHPDLRFVASRSREFRLRYRSAVQIMPTQDLGAGRLRKVYGMHACMEHPPEMLLSESLRSAACCGDNEWGWRPEAIPLVIDEAEKLGLLNIGGQLQFLMPEGICECYWVEVDALTSEPEGSPWAQRVARAASRARQKMADLRRCHDFVEEGRKAFAPHFTAYEAGGGDVRDRM